MSVGAIAAPLTRDLAEPFLARIRIDQIDATEKSWTVREWIDDSDLDMLTVSIRQRGDLDVPLTVRPARGAGIHKYELILGSRRMLGAQRAGHADVLAVVCNVDDREALATAVRADTSSRQLSTLERGWAMVRLRAEWDSQVHGPYKQKRLAERVGAKEATVSEAIRTAEDLPRSMIEGAAEENNIPVAHLAGLHRPVVRKLRKLPQEARAPVLDTVASEIARANATCHESLSLAEVAALALDVLRQTDGEKEDAPHPAFKMDDHGRIVVDARRPVAEWNEDERAQAMEVLGPLLEEVRQVSGQRNADRFAASVKTRRALTLHRRSGTGRAALVRRQGWGRVVQWWERLVGRFSTKIFAGRSSEDADLPNPQAESRSVAS
jgi:ParB/RepB/Spo0J family partition protein